MTGLRRAALLAVLAGETAAATAGVLPVSLLGLAVPVTVAGSLLSARATGSTAVLQRRVATALVLLLALAALPQLTTGGGEDGLRGVLGPLLVGVVAVQSLTWHARRDLRTGVLAAGGLLVLGASYAPDVLVGLPLLVGLPAVLASLVLATRAAVEERADAVLRAPVPRATVLLPTALAAVLGLVAFLLVPVPEDAGLQSRLPGAAGDLAGGGRGAPGAYTGDRVDLRVRGELSDEPLLEVPADSPVLWRSGAYVDWDGASWTRPEEVRELSGPPFVVATSAGPARTDEVRVRRRAQGPVWAPGPVLEAELLGRSAVVDELGAVRGLTWPGYAVRSAVVAPTLEQLRAADGADTDDPRWTRLPASVPQRVRALGQQLADGAATRIDAVLAVEQWLAANATYRLDSPVPDPGQDAVDRFLFVDRTGFCEQFAAAEVLLLRAAGIPARFVTGLAYGVEDDGVRTFRQKDLHAWVEVWHPGLGWVSSNPTPPATQLAGAAWRVRLAAELTVALRRLDALPGGRPALAAALLFLTAGVAGSLVVRRRRPSPAVRPRIAAEAAGGPALQAFLRWDTALGEQRRRPAESLAELRARLDLPPDLHDAIEVVEQECYAADPPARAGEAAEVLSRR